MLEEQVLALKEEIKLKEEKQVTEEVDLYALGKDLAIATKQFMKLRS